MREEPSGSTVASSAQCVFNYDGIQLPRPQPDGQGERVLSWSTSATHRSGARPTLASRTAGERARGEQPCTAPQNHLASGGHQPGVPAPTPIPLALIRTSKPSPAWLPRVIATCSVTPAPATPCLTVAVIQALTDDGQASGAWWRTTGGQVSLVQHPVAGRQQADGFAGTQAPPSGHARPRAQRPGREGLPGEHTARQDRARRSGEQVDVPETRAQDERAARGARPPGLKVGLYDRQLTAGLARARLRAEQGQRHIGDIHGYAWPPRGGRQQYRSRRPARQVQHGTCWQRERQRALGERVRQERRGEIGIAVPGVPLLPVGVHAGTLRVTAQDRDREGKSMPSRGAWACMGVPIDSIGSPDGGLPFGTMALSSGRADVNFSALQTRHTSTGHRIRRTQSGRTLAEECRAMIARREGRGSDFVQTLRPFLPRAAAPGMERWPGAKDHWRLVGQVDGTRPVRQSRHHRRGGRRRPPPARNGWPTRGLDWPKNPASSESRARARDAPAKHRVSHATSAWHHSERPGAACAAAPARAADTVIGAFAAPAPLLAPPRRRRSRRRVPCHRLPDAGRPGPVQLKDCSAASAGTTA